MIEACAASSRKKEITFKYENAAFNKMPNEGVTPHIYQNDFNFGKEHIGPQKWEVKKKRYKKFVYVYHEVYKGWLNTYIIRILQGYNDYL